MTKHVLTFRSDASLEERVARDLERCIAEDVRTRGESHVVLTGGTVGIALLRRVATSPEGIDWSLVHFWWGDERFVDAGSADRNDMGARDALLSRLTIPAENVHAMPALTAPVATLQDLDRARDMYAKDLAEFFGADFPHFDITLLGVGPDAHVASLFPGMPGIEDVSHTVVSVSESPKPPPMRLSLTLPSINSSRRVWVIASGSAKAHAIASAFDGCKPGDSPVGAVRGVEETVFYLDESAATELEN